MPDWTSNMESKDIIPFENEIFGRFEFIKIGEEIWTAADSVCRILDLDNISQACSRLDDEDKATITLNDSGNRPFKKVFITESGFYSLVMSSRKNDPTIKSFKRWVTKEILPSIRKTGKYEAVPTLPEPTKSFEHSILEAMNNDLNARAYQLGVDNKKFLEIRKILLGHSTPELAQTVGELAERTPKEAQESDSKDSYREMIRKVVSEIEGNFDISRVARELAKRGIAIPHGVISNVLHIMAKRKELIFKGKYKSRNRYSNR